MITERLFLIPLQGKNNNNNLIFQENGKKKRGL